MRSVCSRVAIRPVLRQSLVFLPQRGVSKKVLEHGGLSRKGVYPGFPQNTSANVTVPGESEEPDQVIGGFKWLGEDDEEKIPAPFGVWTPESRRCGAIARKIGMMNVWDARGVKTLCTVVKVDECQVVEVKKFLSGRGTPRVNLQLGAVAANPKRMPKCRLVPFRKAGVPPKRRLAEFPVTLDAVLPVGTTIDVRHFIPGQYIDITGTSRGKGFQGGMKRWGFSGQRASHGVSLTHRAIGSTGSAQDPGKVFPGKKMPGHMGNNRVTFLNMLVYKIDCARNLMFIKGTVPGAVETTITLRDAARKPWNADFPPPFPTYSPKEGDEKVSEVVMDVSHLKNPFL